MSRKTIEETVKYTELRETSCDVTFIYCLSDDALPSQYRSLKLFPTSELINTPDPEVNVTRLRPRTRVVYAILVTIFIVSLVIIGILSFMEIQRVLKLSEYEQGMVYNASKLATSEFTSMELITKTHNVHHRSNERTPCLHTCRTYSHPRFKSQCVEWFCVCDGDGYQRDTCLPHMGQCVITKRPSNEALALIDTVPAPVYQCRSEAEGTNEVHIISIYGNHFAEQTIVNISGHSNASTVLVLSSHYPIHWKLTLTDLNIRHIYLISDQNSMDSSIDLPSYLTANRKEPDVTQIDIPVGYGDDRHSGNTTEMMRLLTEKFGRITSFTGAAFSDYFDVEI